MMLEAMIVALGGGIGAVARFLVDGAVQRVNATGIPLGTAAVNATGSFLVGIATGLASAGVVGNEASMFVTMGVLGGYTTFSTACVEAARLLHGGMRRAALLHVSGTLAMSTACLLAGLAACGSLG